MQKVSLQFIRVCGFALKRRFVLSSIPMWVLVRESTTNWKLKIKKYITIQLTREFEVNIFKVKPDFEGNMDSVVI